jgi:hypothetical protein
MAEVQINVLEKAVRDGTFTPIIGAACSSLDHKGEPRYKLADAVRAKARAIGRYLNATERRYLDELIDVDHGFEPQLETEPDPLMAFYVALLRLDRSAAITFKRGVEQYINDVDKECEFLWKRHGGISFPRLIADWHVPLATSEYQSDIIENLRTAIAAAKRLRKSMTTAWRTAGLGAEGIVVNLDSLLSSLVDGGRVKRNASLNLMDLVWIGNLFWHCLRFDQPYYPTTAELAFQLSLCTAAAPGSARNAPPQLAQAAQAIGDPDLFLTDWFRFYGQNAGESGFYHSLATWLQNNYARCEPSVLRSSTSSVPLPIVFTTNYDQEIEASLTKLRCPHHVVMPVYLSWTSKAAGDPEQGSPPSLEPLWLTKTVNFTRNDAWEYAGRTEEGSRSNGDGPNLTVPREEFLGPVIVKLHGSPLDDLPAKGKVGKLPHTLVDTENSYETSYKHRVIITEFDYLKDLRRQIPVWLQRALRNPRRQLFFLGQSISDWNIRLRLADHVSWIDPTEASGKSEAAVPANVTERPYRRVAVNRTRGFFDVAFMDPLRIAQLPVELETVQRTLEGA